MYESEVKTMVVIFNQDCMFCSTQFEVQRELRLHLFNHHLYSRYVLVAPAIELFSSDYFP